MVDLDLVLKKLAFIETCVRDLRTKANIAVIATDVREERFVIHTLQLAIQAALDSASHIVSDYRLGEPNTNRELFDLLTKDQWITPHQNVILGNMAGFHNIIVHGYEAVDLKVVHNIVTSHLDDLLGYVNSIRTRIKSG